MESLKDHLWQIHGHSTPMGHCVCGCTQLWQVACITSSADDVILIQDTDGTQTHWVWELMKPKPAYMTQYGGPRTSWDLSYRTARLIRIYYGCNTPSWSQDVRNTQTPAIQILSHNWKATVADWVEVTALRLVGLISGGNNMSTRNPGKRMGLLAMGSSKGVALKMQIGTTFSPHAWPGYRSSVVTDVNCIRRLHFLLIYGS